MSEKDTVYSEATIDFLNTPEALPVPVFGVPAETPAEKLRRDALAYGVLLCKKHPRYKAIRRPKADCEACRGIYAAKHPTTKG